LEIYYSDANSKIWEFRLENSTGEVRKEINVGHIRY
jgi:hypothetical protein